MTTIPFPGPAMAGKTVAETLARLMQVVEDDCVPFTREAVSKGSKLFGAAILRRDDLSLVCVGTNTEMESPLWHGEVHCIKRFYEIPKEQRPPASECLLLATHEPCSMCTSAICWSGFPVVYYLFTYELTRDAFNIPHDLRMLKEVFGCDRPNQSHIYFTAYSMKALLDEKTDAAEKEPLEKQYAALSVTYDGLSALYQASKVEGSTIILP